MHSPVRFFGSDTNHQSLPLPQKFANPRSLIYICTQKSSVWWGFCYRPWMLTCGVSILPPVHKHVTNAPTWHVLTAWVSDNQDLIDSTSVIGNNNVQLGLVLRELINCRHVKCPTRNVAFSEWQTTSLLMLSLMHRVFPLVSLYCRQ